MFLSCAKGKGWDIAKVQQWGRGWPNKKTLNYFLTHLSFWEEDSQWRQYQVPFQYDDGEKAWIFSVIKFIHLKNFYVSPESCLRVKVFWHWGKTLLYPHCHNPDELTCLGAKAFKYQFFVNQLSCNKFYRCPQWQFAASAWKSQCYSPSPKHEWFYVNIIIESYINAILLQWLWYIVSNFMPLS